MTPPTAVASSARRTIRRRLSARCPTPPAFSAATRAGAISSGRSGSRSLMVRPSRPARSRPTSCRSWPVGRAGFTPRAAGAGRTPARGGSAAARACPSPRSSSRCSGSVRCRIARSSAAGFSIAGVLATSVSTVCTSTVPWTGLGSAVANFAVRSERTSAPVASSTTTRPDSASIEALLRHLRSPSCDGPRLGGPFARLQLEHGGARAADQLVPGPRDARPARHQIEHRERRAQRFFQQAAGLRLLGDAADHLPIA